MKRSGSKDAPHAFFSGASPAEDPDEIDLIPERKYQLRLVLLGRTGSVKSATGNTIIGRNVFKSSTGSSSHTKQCQSETTVRFGRTISVIDTPGLNHTELTEKEVKIEIVKCVTYASPGPHAFIIVIKGGQFTDKEKNTIEVLKEVLGEQILKYTMILFTQKDQLKKKNKTVEEFLHKSEPDLKHGNRFFFLDNESASFPQFKDLISKIETMVEENGWMHFTNDLVGGREKYIQENLNENVKNKLERTNHKSKTTKLADKLRHKVLKVVFTPIFMFCLIFTDF